MRISSSTAPYVERLSLWKLVKYFLWLGSIGFGGPLALVGYMQKDLTEKRGWIGRDDFLNGLALASLCPGPLATQLAIYMGWFCARIWGATVVLVAFTLPAFLMIMVFAVSYSHYGHMQWVQAAFYGISASVIGVVIYNACRLAKMIVARDFWLWGLFVVNIMIAAFTHVQIYLLLLGSGLFVCLMKASPSFLSLPSFFLPVWISIDGLSNQYILSKLFFYFAWTGAVVFGGGLAIIPFIHEDIVQNYHWLTEQQFLDAIGIGMITPGPIILAVTFIGYLIAGFKGAVVATIGIFLPCYLCVVILGPHFSRIAHHETVRAFVQGMTISVAGSIMGSTFILGKSALIDIPTMGIFLGTSFALFFFQKIPASLWLLISGGVGILVKI